MSSWLCWSTVYPLGRNYLIFHYLKEKKKRKEKFYPINFPCGSHIIVLLKDVGHTQGIKTQARDTAWPWPRLYRLLWPLQAVDTCPWHLATLTAQSSNTAASKPEGMPGGGAGLPLTILLISSPWLITHCFVHNYPSHPSQVGSGA